METSFRTLISGSSGNASVAYTKSSALLVDAGAPGKTICSLLAGAELDPAKLRGILVTHDHADHVAGVGVLSQRFDLPVYATEGTWAAMTPRIGQVSEKNRRTFPAGGRFVVGDFSVQSFQIPHDAADPVGFCLDAGGPLVGILTDLGETTASILEAVRLCDVLLLESNHDVEMLRCGPYPPHLQRRILGKRGHLSNEAAGRALRALVEAGVRCAILGHLSAENNRPQLALDTVAGELRREGIRPGQDVLLDLAPRGEPGRLYRIS